MEQERQAEGERQVEQGQEHWVQRMGEARKKPGTQEEQLVELWQCWQLGTGVEQRVQVPDAG